ncbi:MAG: alpha/beta hydrolase [Blastomonas fulva]|uniref:alpha/beta fold hydrolase n=1 Tax=Blastomonas fulva TaxID=1550728 RepID=UPI0024E20B61|nr:alpha/beta hydrolase [Blastomonas fulva]MDK2757111.1 alpha/beta hydrolase [Blastomonas fulva]
MAGPVGRLGDAFAMIPPAAVLGGETFWLDVGDGRLAVETIGRGPAVVLLHGWTLDRRMWTLQARALADRFTLIAIDRRGFGQSALPPCRAREVEDLARLADRLQLASFHLVGMSQAGATAIAYAMAHRDRIATLVLQGISLAGIPDHSNASDTIPLADYSDMVRAGRLAGMKRHWADHPLMAGLTGEAADIGAAMLADYDGSDLLAGPAGPSARLDSMAALTMPVLAITGDADTPWRRTVTQALARSAPLGQARFVRGAGHLCNLSHGLEYNAALCAFLARPLMPVPDAVND